MAYCFQYAIFLFYIIKSVYFVYERCVSQKYLRQSHIIHRKVFTIIKKYVIIKLPNKFHKSILGIFLSLFKRVNYTFFLRAQSLYELCKDANSVSDCVRNILSIA